MGKADGLQWEFWPKRNFAQRFPILSKAKLRMGILPNQTGCKWGAETGIMRLGGDALVVSLLRYGMPVIGSGGYVQSMRD